MTTTKDEVVCNGRCRVVTHIDRRLALAEPVAVHEFRRDLGCQLHATLTTAEFERAMAAEEARMEGWVMEATMLERVMVPAPSAHGARRASLRKYARITRYQREREAAEMGYRELGGEAGGA